MVRQILKLTDATLTVGGSAIEFTVETTDGDSRLIIPVVDLPLFVQFFAGLATLTEDDGAFPKELDPIPVQGLGVQDGSSPDKTILVAKIGAVALALEMPRSELIGMARRLLLAASAPEAGSQPN